MHEASEVDTAAAPLEDVSLRVETPLPWRTVMVLGIVILSDSISGTVIFPFQSFMVDDFHISKNKAEVGYYAGYIGASYFVAQIFCSYFYGWLSGRVISCFRASPRADRFGRRPILLFGLCGSTLSILMLGISPSLAWAVSWRFANGILNGAEDRQDDVTDVLQGNVGVAKTYMAEITDETNQARGFGAMSLIWNVGNILGPVIGGIFSRPAESAWLSVRDYHRNLLLIRKILFPPGSFFGKRYPYLLPCLVAAACTAFGFVMGETLKRKQAQEVQQKSDGEALLDQETPTGSTTSVSPLSVSNDNEALKTPATFGEAVMNMFIVRILSRRKVLISILLYMILGFADVMFENIFPMWAFTDPPLYGLGFSTLDIGITTAIGSVLLLVYNLFGYQMIEARLRPLGCFQLGYAIAIPALVLYPSVWYLLPFGKTILWAGMLTATCIVFFAISTAYMSVFILIANCAPSENLSRVNGIAQTGVAIGRTIAPVLGGSMLAWSLNNGLTFPFNFYFVFIFMAATHAVGACMSFLLPPTINERAPNSEVLR